jgi:hypothetical protein
VQQPSQKPQQQKTIAPLQHVLLRKTTASSAYSNFSNASHQSEASSHFEFGKYIKTQLPTPTTTEPPENIMSTNTNMSKSVITTDEALLIANQYKDTLAANRNQPHHQQKHRESLYTLDQHRSLYMDSIQEDPTLDGSTQLNGVGSSSILESYNKKFGLGGSIGHSVQKSVVRPDSTYTDYRATKTFSMHSDLSSVVGDMDGDEKTQGNGDGLGGGRKFSVANTWSHARYQGSPQ